MPLSFDTATSLDDEARLPGRLRALNRFVLGDEARSARSWALTDEVDAFVTFRSALFSASRAAADPVGRRIRLLSEVDENWNRLELWKHVLYMHHLMCYKIEFTQIIIISEEVELWHRLQSVCIFLFYGEKNIKIFGVELSERSIFELNNELITLIFTLCCGGLRLCGEKNCVLWKFHKLYSQPPSRRKCSATWGSSELNRKSAQQSTLFWMNKKCVQNSSEQLRIFRDLSSASSCFKGIRHQNEIWTSFQHFIFIFSISLIQASREASKTILYILWGKKRRRGIVCELFWPFSYMRLLLLRIARRLPWALSDSWENMRTRRVASNAVRINRGGSC